MTELGGTQISSLMEVLPGIAQVLRSPVADAIVNLIRAACRVREFDLADAEEMLHYAVRRNLMSADESERVLAEAKAIVLRRAERAAGRVAAAGGGNAVAGSIGAVAVVGANHTKKSHRPKSKSRSSSKAHKSRGAKRAAHRNGRAGGSTRHRRKR